MRYWTAEMHKSTINPESPLIMHIDLNSCFASIEQQAHPHLRNRPVAITNRLTKNACIITCSYEAKALGVKVGMRFSDAQRLAPNIVMVESDPAKYHFVYCQLTKIMKSYSPKVKMKSIDEGIIDFHNLKTTSKPLVEIALEIKTRLRTEVGNYMRCNIGIGPNQFLAKLAAGLNKPDGLDVISADNLIAVLSKLELTDLPGIADHYSARLKAHRIFNPIDFLNADADFLHRQVFKSIVGQYWHSRLRGYEVDDIKSKKGVVGRQFVMDGMTNDEQKLLARMQHLSQSTGMKLRSNNLDARGVAVWCDFANGESYFKRKMFKTTFFSDKDIFERVVYLFNQRPTNMKVIRVGLYCYQLTPTSRSQLSILDSYTKNEDLTLAIDEINQRYGNFVITYANALDGSKIIKQKVPFGGIEYFKLLINNV